MNTIVAQMPTVSTQSGPVQKDNTQSEDKSTKFEDLLNGQKEQTQQETTVGTDKPKADTKETEIPLPQHLLAALCFTDAAQMLAELTGDIQLLNNKAADAETVETVETVETAEAVKEQPEAKHLSKSPVEAELTKNEMPKASAGENEQAVNENNAGIVKVNTEKPAETEPLEGLQKTAAQTVEKDTREPDTTVKPELHIKEDVPVHNTVNQNIRTEKPVTHGTDDIKPEYVEQLKSSIVKEIASGKQEFSIQLTPSHLGTLVIKASYEAGKAVISIVCNEAKTMQVMSQQARELAQMVEDRTGNHTEVVVDKPSEDYLQQQNNQENSGREQQSERRQEENKKAGFQDSFDFLQQLRLGLA